MLSLACIFFFMITINSYTDKPSPEDLQYFLEFQVPQQWAPMFNELDLGPQRRKSSFPALHFTCFSPKLLVNNTQVLTKLCCTLHLGF